MPDRGKAAHFLGKEGDDDARTRQLMQISITFTAPRILPRAAWAVYRKGAQGFRKVGRSTYERTFRFRDDPKHLVNQTLSAVHEIFDIARRFGLENFIIVGMVGKVEFGHDQ